jgi:hypothetical protein
MLYRRCAIWLACSFLALVSSSINATVLAPAEFHEIVNQSEIIAFGRVIDARAELSDDRERVDTIVTLQVGTYLKGGPGETVVFQVPGGQIGRYRDVMIGAPIFEAGDEAVVFLNVRGRERPTVFGLNQGVFRVRIDDRTKRRVVVSPALMARSDSPEVVVRGSVERRAVPLETFGVQVKTVMAEAGPRAAR